MKQLKLFNNELDAVVDERDKKYSMKAKSPIYTPKEGLVLINDCYDTRKFNTLFREIERSNISESEKKFLKFAATRHLVFNYERIADYYAQASKEVQCLMEKSALVVIDFDDAINYGYVELNKKMMDLYELENGAHEKRI